MGVVVTGSLQKAQKYFITLDLIYSIFEIPLFVFELPTLVKIAWCWKQNSKQYHHSQDKFQQIFADVLRFLWQDLFPGKAFVDAYALLMNSVLRTR